MQIGLTLLLDKELHAYTAVHVVSCLLMVIIIGSMKKKKKKACKIVNLRLQSSLNFCLQRTSFVASWWPLLRIGDQYKSWQAQTLYHEQILEASTEWLNSMIDLGESNNLSYPAWHQHMCILDSVGPISSHIWNVFFKSSPLKWLVLHLVEE